MKNYEATLGIWLLGCSLAVSCSDSGPLPARKGLAWSRANASSAIKGADLGSVPGGLMDPKAELIPLIGESGELFGGTINRDAEITTNVEKHVTCKINKGTSVSLIAANGIFVRVRGNTICATGESKVAEGFVLQGDVEETGKISGEQVFVPSAKPSGEVLPSATSSNGAGNATAAIPSTTTTSTAAGALPSTTIASTTTVATASSPPSPPAPTFPGCRNISASAPTSMATPRGEVFSGPARTCGSQGGSCTIMGGSLGGLLFRVEGNAPKFRFKFQQGYRNLPETTLDSAQYRAGEIFQFPLTSVANFRQWDNEMQGVSVTVVGLNESGQQVGKECNLGISWISPLVLDLANVGQFSGVNLAESTARFDLLGNGQKLATGWIKPTMGFLALDKNKNGKIDDGRELFGQGTALKNGLQADNGYVALAELDSNKDGVVDKNDTAFANLVVWIDANENGISEKGEIRSLKELAIQKIGLVYSRTKQNEPQSLFDNDVRYEARYWGPTRCGTEGCRSFDVYFATASVASAKR